MAWGYSVVYGLLVGPDSRGGLTLNLLIRQIEAMAIASVMKKAYYIPIVIIAILIITNPSLKDFKEHEGITTAKLESEVLLSRTHNYFICSTYNINGSDATYFGVIGNFFYFKSSKQKSAEQLQSIYDLLGTKLELGSFDDFKEHLKDRMYRIEIYKQATALTYSDTYQNFEKDITLATN